MPEEVTYFPGDKIIKVRSYGENSLKDWQGSLRAIIDIKDREGIRQVLVDTREQTLTPGIEDVYEFSRSIPDDLIIAIVVPDVIQGKDWEEIERVFAVQGTQFSFTKISNDKGKQIKQFREYDEAVSWLENTGC